MTEIIDNLFVGSMADAKLGFDGLIISVLEEKSCDGPPDALCIPFMTEGVAALDRISAAIDEALAGGRRVLVHCGAGSERAPCAIAWFLHRRREMALDAAYDLLKFKRPVVQDRRAWLRQYLPR
jgi:protein-tyrosine phosphatase